ncbi:LpqB family beta-propeller domain-containing protein [Terrabacter ginsenosidimutans]|uniref:LpqB family beta-propeller domain-containing protein n=1 Tax=Terrabacter ginsenosidimutans TaxID=490575 RepID=A0ABP7D2X9_9MICO
MRARLLACLLLVASLVLSACGGGLPGTGPVVEGRALGEVLNEPVRVVAVGPVDGASQEAIVRGFLRAGEDTDETHATGRSFLAPQSVDLWRWSSEDVVVYDGDLTIKRLGDDAVEVSASGMARLTPDGRYIEQPPGAREKVTFGLTKVGGEWRIELPASGFGLWLDKDQFNRVFVKQFIHYVSRNGRDLVPDARWFPIGTRLATTLARAQLSAVPPYLAGAVSTGVPPGTRLAVNAVPVTAGKAQVNLSSEALSADPANRAAMWAQLTKTLSQVSSVGSVSLAVDNTQLELPGGVTSVTSAADLGYDTVPQTVFDTALLRNGDAIRRFDPRYVPDTQASKRPDLKPKDGDIARIPDTWESLALSVDGKQVAAVSGDRRVLSIWRATAQMKSVAPFASSLTRPVYDAEGYLWIAGSDDSGDDQVFVLDSVSGDPSAAARPVSTPWLKQRRVKAMAVSADATRVLIVTTDRNGADVQMGLSGIVRATNGEPQALAQPLRQAQSLTRIQDVTWLDPASYAVLGQVRANDAMRPWLASIGAGVDGTRPGIGQLSAVPGGVTITTVGGPRGILIVTSDNRVLARAGSNWPLIERGSDVLVPGG